MENRKYVRFLVPISILGLFIFQNSVAFAYSVNTHAYLTSEVVKFYNQNFSSNKIPENLNDYLIDGSRREDDAPRWMNHFYDPVNNRGLVDSSLGTWQKSEDWAQDGNNQNGLTYKVPATIASILTAIQQRSILAITDETDFTWQRAIKFYVAGDKEKAIFLLGHVIHLVEDTSVPEHTRNDAHVLNIPYENYAGQFSIYNPDTKLSQRLAGNGPIILDNLNPYFDGLAKYSNNNFYSFKTIGIQSGYDLPEPIDYENLNNLYYGLNKDIDGYYKLSVQPTKSSVLMNVEGVVSIDDKKVLSDYWSRLSVKSVQYGAGVIDLFFREVEKAKNDPNFNTAEEKSFIGKAVEAVSGLVAQVGSTTSAAISSVGNFLAGIFSNNQDFKQVGQIDLNKDENQIDNQQLTQQPAIIQGQKSQAVLQISENQTEQPQTEEAVMADEEQKNIQEDLETEQVVEDDQLQKQIIKPASANLTQCFFNASQSPSRQKVIINEVAWMGTANSANDEWVELKNISGDSIDINNWQLIDKDEQIKINFASINGSKIIGPGKFILLERTDDNSVPGIKADLIYSGALSNSNEGLRLFDGQCSLMDEALTGSDWPAGSSSEKKTMERNASSFGWYTSVAVNGTPKAENSAVSAPAQTQSQAQTIYSGGGQMPQRPAQVKILINKVQISPAGDRFIELYNPNDFAVNLTNWYIQRKTQTGASFSSLVSKTHFENKIIQSKGYLLISRSASADIILDGLTLTEANSIQIKNFDGDIVDKVGWGAASDCEGDCALEPAENQSIERKIQNSKALDTDNNANDFELKSGSASQSNRAPSAFFDYLPKSSQVGEVINFDASSSTDPDGQITTYQWDFGDGGTLISASPAGSHTYSRFGNYEVGLVVFNILGVSSTPATANVSVSISGADHVVISEIMAGTNNSADEEFVELYNPINQEVSLSGWSLKRKISSNSTSTVNLVREFPAGSAIPAKGFFLIAHENYSNYSTSTSADIIYSNNSNPLAYSDDTVILYNGAGGAVDEVYYQNIDKGKSLERKAWVGDTCALLQQSNEFLGNACDSNSNNDFDLREMPTPQNSLSLPEPRNKPTTPGNFNIQYSQNEVKVDFSWNESQDYSGNSSEIVYKIFDVSTAQLAETTSTAVSATINEVGRDYQFSIQAFDKDGLGSDAATSTLNIPSFLSGLYIYQNPANAGENLVEARYDQYPFVPDKFNKGISWKILVFYLNADAKGDINNSSWEPNDLIDVLGLSYRKCAGGSGGNSLLLPDSVDKCGLGGGAYNAAFDFSDLGNNNFIVKTAKPNQELNLSENNFITAAFYSVSSVPTMDGTNPTFQLVATDKTKYYFGVEPVRQKPVLSGLITANFDKVNSKLNLSWPKATDVDTLEEFLTYEIKYNNNEEWQSLGVANNTSRFVLPGDAFSISVRAKDNFDNYSEQVLSLDWSYPVVDFYVSQEIGDYWNPFGNAANCGFVSGLQSFVPDVGAGFDKFDTAILKIKLFGGSFSSDLKLSVFGDSGGRPDFGNLIAESTISSYSAGSFDGNNLAFGFSSPVQLSAGSKYWFELQSGHSGSPDWSMNYWKNSLSYNNLYAGGEAGQICSTAAGHNDSTFSTFNGDWYMKLGLQK